MLRQVVILSCDGRAGGGGGTLTSASMTLALDESSRAEVRRAETSAREEASETSALSCEPALEIPLVDALFFPALPLMLMLLLPALPLSPSSELSLARFARKGAVDDDTAGDAAAFDACRKGCTDDDDDNDDDDDHAGAGPVVR
jgi:hypothetical protein